MNGSVQAGALRRVPVLAGLDEELLAELATQLVERTARAGEWIFHEGEDGESMFLIAGGRVEIVHEGPPETLIRVLRRSDVLGELALLRRSVRSASARALRDTQLFELSRTVFEQLILDAPSFALGLTRSLGAQLAEHRTPIADARPPRTIAVIGAGPGAPVQPVVDELERTLAGYGSVIRLDAGGLAAIDRAEAGADRLILRGDAEPDGAWNRLLAREAELVVVVALGGARLDPAWAARARALRGCELLVVGGATAGGAAASDAFAALQAGGIQVVAGPAQLRPAVAGLGRRIAGRALGIVLSGGGARALAHLGVVQELLAAGLRFDRAAGVSAGGLIAAALACGFTIDEILRTFHTGFVGTNPTNDYSLPAYSLIRGAKTRRLLAGAFGDRRIEELPLRFFALSCDLNAREPVVHRTGRVVDAVYASLAIPGVFPPVATPDGRLLVDGGVLDNLPVTTMARRGEGPVIAVDVTGHADPAGRSVRRPRRRVAGALRRGLTGSDAPIPRLGETIVRTVTVGSIDTVAAARRHADLVITPATEGVGLMDWRAMPRIVELGREAARAALAGDPTLVATLNG